MKCWDLGGQAQYRQEWGRYTRGCDAILFVIDTNAYQLFGDARRELHRLLEDKDLATTPLLVVANKIDLDPHASESVVIKGSKSYNVTTYHVITYSITTNHGYIIVNVFLM